MLDCGERKVQPQRWRLGLGTASAVVGKSTFCRSRASRDPSPSALAQRSGPAQRVSMATAAGVKRWVSSSDADELNKIRVVTYNLGITSHDWASTNRAAWRWKALYSDLQHISCQVEMRMRPSVVVLQECGPFGEVHQEASWFTGGTVHVG